MFKRQIDPQGGWGDDNTENIEMRTVVLSPVYSDDPNHENKKFWNYTPSGSISLGVVNQDAWKHFELGKEYYIEFRKAD